MDSALWPLQWRLGRVGQTGRRVPEPMALVFAGAVSLGFLYELAKERVVELVSPASGAD
jgi:hypothetical protein